MRLALTLALRDLRGGLRGFRIFLACLAMGVAAIAAVGSMRAAIEAGLDQEGAALLGGDAAIEFTYRFANDAERDWMTSVSDQVSETVEFRSMVVTGSDDTRETALTQVRAVDDAYPLVGAVSLAPPIPLAQAFAGENGMPGIVIEPVLADRLGLIQGDVLRLGTQSFVLMAVLQSYPDNSGGGLALGPRSLVLSKDLKDSGLITPGTLYSTEYRMTVPAGTDLEQLKQSAQTQFPETGLRWRDARAGAPGLSTFVDRLGAFLVLVGLSGLAVGGVGISAAVRAYLTAKAPVIATLKTLGASRRMIFASYGVQIGILTIIGVTIGIALGVGGVLAVAPFIAAQLPVPAVFGVYAAPIAEAALYGVLAAAIFTLWPLARAEETRPAALFRDTLASAAWPAPRYLIATAGLVGALVAAAAHFAQSWTLTLWSFAAIIGTLIILALAAQAVRWFARWYKHRARPSGPLKWAIAAIGRRGGETTPVVISLGLGLSVLAIVGQVDGTLRSAIQTELPDVAPSYFVVDIQPDQIDPIRTRVENDPGVSRMDAAPMLRGIITRINGQPAADIAGDHWVLQGDRGVTYSATQPEGTTLTAGAWWAEDTTAPEISFAADEAAEMGLKLGDQLTVNILGRDITGQITSFREVNFQSAGIGFVMAMSPAALAGAPHSWIATIYADAGAEAQLLRDLSKAYPNITAIRVRDGIDRAAALLGGIADATRYGAAVSLLTGVLVLIGAALASERDRTFESAVLKTLGAGRRQILYSFAWRGALAGLAAGLVALAAGALGGWAIARFVMDVGYSVIWGNAFAVIGTGVFVSCAAGIVFAIRPLNARPAQVLRARD